MRIYLDSFSSYTISTEVSSGLQHKSMKEEEIAEVYQQLGEYKKAQKKKVFICVPIFAVFAVLLAVGGIIADEGAVVTISCVVFAIAVLAVPLFIVWHLNIGKVAGEWNKLLKANYPDICKKYKL